MSDTTPVSFRAERDKLQTLKNLNKSVSSICQKAIDREFNHHLLTEGCNMDHKTMIAMQRRIRDRLSALRAEYEKESSELFAELTRITVLREQASVGLDTEKIQIAQSILEVRGFYHDRPAQTRGDFKDETPVRKQMLEELIDELATNDGARLFQYYYGVKNYSYFGDQRCDCMYGLGPDHGSIVFSIGLKDEARTKRKFTYKQIDAVIYFLEQMLRKRIGVEKEQENAQTV